MSAALIRSSISGENAEEQPLRIIVMIQHKAFFRQAQIPGKRKNRPSLLRSFPVIDLIFRLICPAPDNGQPEQSEILRSPHRNLPLPAPPAAALSYPFDRDPHTDPPANPQRIPFLAEQQIRFGLHKPHSTFDFFRPALITFRQLLLFFPDLSLLQLTGENLPSGAYHCHSCGGNPHLDEHHLPSSGSLPSYPLFFSFLFPHLSPASLSLFSFLFDRVTYSLHLQIKSCAGLRTFAQLFWTSSEPAVSERFFLYLIRCSRFAQNSMAIVRSCTSTFIFFFSSCRKMGISTIRCRLL